MKLLLPAGVFAGLLLAAPAPFARAEEPKSKAETLPRGYRPAVFLDDPNYQKELGLTPEQVKTLLASREKEWDESYTTPPKEPVEKTEERNKAAVATLKAVLTAEQFKRAEQLALQRSWARRYVGLTADGPATTPDWVADPTRVSAHVLNDFPAVAEALNLSEDQKKVAAPLAPRRPGGPALTNPATILLTAEQTETARRLLGRIAKTDWKAEQDPRDQQIVRLWYYDGALAALMRTGERDVRAELHLTDEQDKTLAPLREAYAVKERTRYTLSLAAAKKQGEEMATEAEKALAATLKPEQLVRLRQLAVRRGHDPAWGNTNTPLVVNLAKELGLTAEQQKACAAVQGRHAEAVARAAVGERGYDEAHRTIRAANRARDAELEAVLTAGQKAALKAVVGEPLASRIRPDYGPHFGRIEPKGGAREPDFGHYTNELALLTRNKIIQAELKLNADQLEVARKAVQELSRREGKGFARPMAKLSAEEVADQRAARTKFIAEALTGALLPDQDKRFREIMMQQRHFPAIESFSSRRGIPSAVTYPGVAEAVKLTADQKKRLIDGEHPADVLSDEQRKAIREMLGERYGGDYEIPFAGGTTPSRPLDAADRARAEFLPYIPWEATKFTPEEVTKLATAVTRYQREVRALLGDAAGAPGFGRPKEPAGDPTQRARWDLRREMTRSLPPPQRRDALARIDQLELQYAAAANLPKAFARPDVSKTLQVTPSQLVRMSDAETEAGLVAELVAHARLGLEKRNEVLRDLRDRLDDRILGILTPEQSAKWKELTGEKWAGFVKPLVTGPPRRSGQ